MYVDTMTFSQISKEIIKDRSYLCSKVNYVLEDSKYRRASLKLKNEGYHPFKRVDFTSKKTGFEYHLLPFVFGKRDYLKNSMGFCVFLTFRKHNRLWACFIGQSLTEVLFFTPHFFDRYAERGDGDSDNRLDLITGFFMKNRAFNYSEYLHPKHPDSIFVTIGDGIGLGSKLDGSSKIVTTYVSKDMLYEEQTVIRAVGKDILNECYRKFSKDIKTGDYISVA